MRGKLGLIAAVALALLGTGCQEIILRPPVACFEIFPAELLVGEGAFFDASCSYSINPGGYIVSYRWKVGNEEWETSGPITYFVFSLPSEPGSFQVDLTVQDNYGLKSSAFQFVKVRKKTVILSFGPEIIRAKVGEIFTAPIFLEGKANEIIIGGEWLLDRKGQIAQEGIVPLPKPTGVQYDNSHLTFYGFRSAADWIFAALEVNGSIKIHLRKKEIQGQGIVPLPSEPTLYLLFYCLKEGKSWLHFEDVQAFSAGYRVEVITKDSQVIVHIEK